MTRRDYVLIAGILRDTVSVERTSRTLLAEAFAHALKATNPRFDAERFVRYALDGEPADLVAASVFRVS